MQKRLGDASVLDYIQLVLVPEICLRFFQQKYNATLEIAKGIINATKKIGNHYCTEERVQNDRQGSNVFRIATDDELSEEIEEYSDSDEEIIV